MKNIFKFAGVAATILAFAQTLHATQIVGDIGFTGRASYDTGSSGSATEVVAWYNTRVNGTSGAFTTAADGDLVTFAAPWFFNTTSPITSFWSVDGFVFTLLASSITYQANGSVVVNGSGTVAGNGYDATPLSWSFTSQDPATTHNPDTFTFSASSNSVPDGGTTIALLGVALSGVGLLRKKLAA